MTDRPTFGPEVQQPATEEELASFRKDLNSIPLFMNELPEEENDVLEALRSLVYDGTPEEIVENFKERGNEFFKQGKLRYQDAIQSYTEAIATECDNKKLVAQCYANRAAVHLKLGNYGRTLRDCASCLQLDPENTKALYRSAMACLALEKIEPALDCCERGLTLDPDNEAFKIVQRDTKKRQADVEARTRREKERAVAEQAQAESLSKAINARGIRLDINDKGMYNKAELTYDNATDTLNWSVFFLYPEYKESDYIQSFDENTTFLDHLSMMFEQPAPWDTEQKYTPSNVEVYFENNQGLHPRLIKIGKKLTLKKVLSSEQYVVNNGIPNFIILPKNAPFATDFIEKYRTPTQKE